MDLPNLMDRLGRTLKIGKYVSDVFVDVIRVVPYRAAHI
jgi:hypothetical protein